MNLRGKKVFVGLSGGVDSSVSALLLKEAGAEVTGVFIKVWQPDFVPCTWREDRLDAMRVAARLEIPFRTLDLEEEYKTSVIDRMIGEYAAGRTPNPDVLCNAHVKFGAFLGWAVSNGADMIATGHYARVQEEADGSYALLRGSDAAKDQAYFLYHLGQNELSRSVFPVGGMKKKDVRRRAAAEGLPTALKSDSQGLCFISNVDMKEFLSRYIEPQPGRVLNEGGRAVGTHPGALFFTVGERHGFSLSDGDADSPRYVVAKDMEQNTITVSSRYPSFPHGASVGLSGISSVSGKPLEAGQYEAEFRYHGEKTPVALSESRAGSANLTLLAPALAVPGQSAVLYAGERCLGGGIIL